MSTTPRRRTKSATAAPEDAVLPGLGEGARERDRRPEMAPIAAGPAPLRKPFASVVAELGEASGTEEHEGEDGAKATSAASNPPPRPAAA